MQPQLLFSPEDLPIPTLTMLKKPSWKNVVKLSKKAVAEMFDKMQLNFNDLLNKPILLISGKRKYQKKLRNVEWDDANVFAGSITVTHRNSEVDSANVLTDWSNDRFLEMHQWVMEESMEALREEGNPEEKLDILEWIFSPNYIEKIGKSYDGRPCIVRRHASDIPFSFLNCCRSIGMRDPDNFRELLVEQMSDEFRPQLERFLQVTQGKSPT
jgi:hypothetical protein